MPTQRLAVTTLAAVFLGGGILLGAQPKGETFTREELRQYFATEAKLDPDKAGLYRRLLQMFPKQETFTAAEVSAVTNPKTSGLVEYEPAEIDQKGPAPRDTFTAEQVKEHFALIERRNPKQKELFAALQKKYGPQDWYLADQLRDVETNGPEPAKEALPRALPDLIAEAVERGNHNAYEAQQGFRTPRLRRDWRDVLYDEDMSQPANRRKKLGDLVGAKISYAYDGKTHSDTWNTQGALIFPYVRQFATDDRFALQQFAVAPSVSVNRISTDGDPAAETDSVFYRLGVYMDFIGLTHPRPPKLTGDPAADALARANSFGSPFGLQVRGAGVYVTDLAHEAGLEGFEVDIEPRLLTSGLSLGYRTIVIGKEPLKPDGSDISFLECQLRTWLHAEGGEVQDAGPGWGQSGESFFRLGPVAEFQLLMPALPGDRALSLTVNYSYLPAVSGPTEHQWYFRSTFAYDLYSDPTLNHKVSLNLEYQRGGLNFTKQEVDTFTIGLGILF